MADQHDNAQRPRPFVPPVRPFGGPLAPARPASTPLTPPEGARAPAPFVARRPAKPVEEEQQPAPPPVVPSAPRAAPALPSAGDAHLYGHDPFAAAAPLPSMVDHSPVPAAAVVPGEDAAPEEAASALAGLPYFDDTGSEHTADAPSAPARTSGKVHRVGFDPAGVLESIAGRIRSGALALGDIDPQGSDEATLASILAALLRASPR